MKEATARIKINKLLEAAGWRFFADGNKPANIQLEPGVMIKASEVDALGEDFEKASKGFIDFLLLNEKGFPFIVLEAKAEDKNPLIGKEQARKYARSQDCRFVILSNGNLHYFWDLERGNPYVITAFPTPQSVSGYQKVRPNPQRLIEEQVDDDYIVLTQRPSYQADAAWRNETERTAYVAANKLRFLRPYQEKAIHALQAAVKEGKDRFLFEMATGTGKTLTAAAIIKLFLRSGNAQRVLFLVDRLELEDQAKKAFTAVLANDYTYAKLVDDRNESAHPNGNIFYSTEAALDAKISEILRVVGEIQTHSKPVIDRCYREFLLQNHDAEEREYPDAADQIREVLIHGNYLSQKDIEICLAFDIAALQTEVDFPAIKTLHQSLHNTYAAEVAAEAA